MRIKINSKNLFFLIKSLIILFAYFVTAKFGLRLEAVSGFATLVWLPSGLSLAFVLLWGFKFWPSIALGAFLANLSTGASLTVAAGIGIGNTLEALTGAYLLKKVVDFNISLDRLKDVLGLFFLAALLSTLFSATLGTSSLYLGHAIKQPQYLQTWIIWWVGDMVSDLVVAPLILVWAARPKISLMSLKKRFWELVALAVSMLVAIIIIFGKFVFLEAYLYPRGYVIFPVLIWAALRFGMRGATTVTFILSAMTVYLTFLKVGPFSGPIIHQSLMSVQVYMSVMSVSAMILAAVASERMELERRKDEFISIASHELKTPLTAVKGYSQIMSRLLKKDSSQRLSGYLVKMEKQLDRLTKLVNDLLNVSKIQTGKLLLQKEKLAVDDLIKDTIEDLQMIDHHQIIFEKNGKIPKIWADKYRVNEVIVNLLSNAIKYSPKANQVIVRTLNSRNGVLVEIQDFGIGISKKDRDRIFQRFFQAGNRIRQSFSGLGLGLYISSEIIKQHGGQIWVESVKGKGSTVSFLLPKEVN